MAPNKDVNVFVLDVGRLASTKNDKDELSFLDMSKACVSRIAERLIFSRPDDLVMLFISGARDADNDLGRANIAKINNLDVPSWDFIDSVQKISGTELDSNWLDSIQVAVDYLKNNLEFKKYARKKIVLLTDTNVYPRKGDVLVDEVVNELKDFDIDLVLIGPDAIDAPKSNELITHLVNGCDVTVCTFQDAIHQLLFHKKKATRPMPWNVDLRIGPDISIPVTGFGKIREDKSVKSWKKAYKNLPDSNKQTIITKKNYFKIDDNTAQVDLDNIVDGYQYGETIVPFTKLDTALKYESGPRCLTLFGFTKAENIHWNDLSGDGVTYLVARGGNENASAAIAALVTNLIELEHVAIVRRVYNNGNAPHMYAMLPMVDGNCKFFSMIALAFKEDYRYIEFPSLNKKVHSYTAEQADAIDDLIDAMELSDKDFNVENAINPTLQNFFDTISHRARFPDEPLPPPRPEVLHLVEIPDAVSKLMNEPVQKIRERFELIIKEKPKSGKSWVDNELKSDNGIAERVESAEPPTAISVVTAQITEIGTVQPVQDFHSLLSYGEPFDSVSDLLIIVIERLVLLSFDANYSKPLSALKAFREESVKVDPGKYNKWLPEFKNVLLSRSKDSFFEQMVGMDLGLITEKESTSSQVTEQVAANFKAHSNQQPEEYTVNESDFDELFD